MRHLSHFASPRRWSSLLAVGSLLIPFVNAMPPSTESEGPAMATSSSSCQTPASQTDRLVATCKLVAAASGLNIGSMYDPELAESTSGKLLEHHPVTEDEEVYIHEGASYVLWKQGPEKGHIYRILQSKEGLNFNPPSLEAFYEHLKAELIRYPNLEHGSTRAYRNKKTGEIVRDQQPNKPESKSEDEWEALWMPTDKMKAQSNLSDYLYRFFTVEKYGNLHLRNAQYFHYSDKSKKEANQLYYEIHTLGMASYIKNFAARILLIPKIEEKIKTINQSEAANFQGRNSELIATYEKFIDCLRQPNKLIKDFDITKFCEPKSEEKPKRSIHKLILDFDLESKPEVPKEEFHIKYEAFPQISQTGPRFTPNDDLAKQLYNMPSHHPHTPSSTIPKLVLTHGTSSRKLPNIIQLKGLLTFDEAERKGIKKTYGGETGQAGAMDHEKVSF